GVSYYVGRCPRGAALYYPYLTWLTAVATFLPAIANDYNFAALPLAALAVWDRRDPLPVQVLLAFLLLWWQPIRLPVGAELLFTFKALGVVAVGWCLVSRAREQRVEAAVEDRVAPPAAAVAQAA